MALHANITTTLVGRHRSNLNGGLVTRINCGADLTFLVVSA